VKVLIFASAYLLGAPLLGGLISGFDRKITARMQGRVGPPIWQPFFDVLKLIEKENLVVRRSQNFYIVFFLILVIFTGGLFFTGEDILLVIFALTLAGIFFVLGGYKTSSPYSFIGAQRELLQMMSYEPAVILSAVGMYMVTKSFYVADIFYFDKPLYLYLPGILASFVFILAIKFRKSPFDLSMSHHAHQELVKGITTEFSGKTLGLIEIAHWYENAFILGFIYLFFASNALLAVFATLGIYFFIIVVDNVFARAKWQMTLVTSWAVALVFGLGNIIVLHFFKR